MEKYARTQLYNEEQNWLNRSRVLLMESLLNNAGPIEGPLLDVGSGSGHAIEKLSKYGQVDAVETAAEAWSFIEKRPLRNLYKNSIPNDKINEQYGVIVGLEVLEHIEDDTEALSWFKKHLKPGGVLVLTVPSYQWLFGAHDEANNHYRRYTIKNLLTKLPPELTILKSGYYMTTLFPLALIMRLFYNIINKNKQKELTKKKQKSSVPLPFDFMFGLIMKVEAFLAGLGISLPFGMTIYLMVRKSV